MASTATTSSGGGPSRSSRPSGPTSSGPSGSSNATSTGSVSKSTSYATTPPASHRLVTTGTGTVGVTFVSQGTTLSLNGSVPSNAAGGGSAGANSSGAGSTSSGMGTGVLVAIIAGGAAALVVLATVILLCRRSRKKTGQGIGNGDFDDPKARRPRSSMPMGRMDSEYGNQGWGRVEDEKPSQQPYGGNR